MSVVLTQTREPAIASSVPAEDAKPDDSELLDLERCLDATKSNLLFARNVMLVEGPAELFLIPTSIIRSCCFVVSEWAPLAPPE
jgi:putative ATP-dependent endonuclease of OLD family